MKLWKAFRFEAAHRLPYLPSNHPCSRIHGHSYRFVIHCEGELDPALGWVCDFAMLGAAGAMICQFLDHRDLNGIEGLENPTAENLAVWIWDRVKITKLGDWLTAIEVMETEGAGVRYEGALWGRTTEAAK